MNTIDFVPDPDRGDAFSRSVRAEYDRTTVIDRTTTSRPARPEENGGFVRIGQRFYAEPELFVQRLWRPGVSYSPVVVGLGQSITIGEEKYVISCLDRVSEPRPVSSLAEIAQIIESDRIPRFTAAFLPLDCYRSLYLERGANVGLSFDKNRSFVNFGSQNMAVFWSSKYVEYGKAFLVGQNSTEWVTKLDEASGHRLRVNIKSKSEIGKFDVVCETIAKFTVNNPSDIFVFALPSQEYRE